MTADDSDIISLEFETEYDKYGNGISEAKCLARITSALPAATERAPVSVTLVIDASGSMQGTLLSLAKRACTFLIEQLEDKDSVSVLSYDQYVRSIS